MGRVRQFHVEIIRRIHIPILARGIEWMVRIREGNEGEKRRVVVRQTVQMRNRLITDIGRGVKLFRDRRAVRLWARIVMRQLVCGIVQGLPILGLIAEPLLVVATTFVTMRGHHINVVISIVRRLEIVPCVRCITAGFFLPVVLFIQGPSIWATCDLVRFDTHRGNICKGLQVALPDCGGVVSSLSQLPNKGIRV